LRLPFFTTLHRYMPALFQTYGYEVAYVPVNDRPRQAGVSKYNNLNRALVGLYDLVGVTWLRQRTRVPRIVDRYPETNPVADIALRLKPVNDDGARASAGDKS
jgi:dolichol-phosphate mannosyltransferase